MSIFIFKCFILLIIVAALVVAFHIHAKTVLEKKSNLVLLRSLEEDLKQQSQYSKVLQQKVALSDNAQATLQQQMLTICKELLQLQEYILKFRG